MVAGVETWGIENEELIEKWKDKRNFNFPHLCLVGGGKMEGWKKISFFLYINLLICPC